MLCNNCLFYKYQPLKCAFLNRYWKLRVTIASDKQSKSWTTPLTTLVAIHYAFLKNALSFSVLRFAPIENMKRDAESKSNEGAPENERQQISTNRYFIEVAFRQFYLQNPCAITYSQVTPSEKCKQHNYFNKQKTLTNALLFFSCKSSKTDVLSFSPAILLKTRPQSEISTTLPITKKIVSLGAHSRKL